MCRKQNGFQLLKLLHGTTLWVLPQISNVDSVFMIQKVVLDPIVKRRIPCLVYILSYHTELLCHHSFDTTAHYIVGYSLKQNLQSCGLKTSTWEPSNASQFPKGTVVIPCELWGRHWNYNSNKTVDSAFLEQLKLKGHCFWKWMVLLNFIKCPTLWAPQAKLY